MENFASWNRQATKNLMRAVRRRLEGVTVHTDGADLVETLLDLDDALDGGPPAAVALDELDVLLLPEQGSGGRHMANRLGNTVFHNLVVMGTVQRFHRSVHEFKNWQTVECPADLSWADGVTYFFGPLRDPRGGPRVEWLDRVGVTPRLFADEIEPAVGLRPYFWGRLRAELESVVRADLSRSRLADVHLVRSSVAKLVTDDAHLGHVMEDGEELTPAERRRRDLLSVEERRILRRFAEAERPGRAVSVSEAERIGGRAAVDELVDRAYLTLDPAQGRLRIAVRIYEDFLRSRLSVLREVTPDGPRVLAAGGRPAGPPAASTRADARPGRTAEPEVRADGATGPSPGGSGASGSSTSSSPARSAKSTVVAPHSTSSRSSSTPSASSRASSSATSPAATTRDRREQPPRPPADKRPSDTSHRNNAASTTPPGPPRSGELTGSPSRRQSSPAATSSDGRPRTTRPSSAKPGAAGPARPGDGGGEPTATELRRITVVLRAELADRSVLPLAEAGPLINQAVSRISAANRWAGAGRLTDFFEIHLPEFELDDGASGRVVRPARGRVRRFLGRLVTD